MLMTLPLQIVLPAPLSHKISLCISEEGTSWPDVETYIPFFEAVIAYSVDRVFKEKKLEGLYEPIKGFGLEVSLLLTHDKEIQVLNANWRKKDKPTNIISFPGIAHVVSSLEEKIKEHIILFPQGPLCLGDIALSYETCSAEAISQNKPLLWHLLHLLSHGCLHLLGYTHDTDADAEEMEQLEKEVLSLFHIPDPYL